jgi:hypothetical protein
MIILENLLKEKDVLKKISYSIRDGSCFIKNVNIGDNIYAHFLEVYIGSTLDNYIFELLKNNEKIGDVEIRSNFNVRSFDIINRG